MYNKLRNIPIDIELEKTCATYCRNSYKEAIQLQIFLADNSIPFTYTDTISLSELLFLYNTTNEYIEEKNNSLDELMKDSNKG